MSWLARSIANTLNLEDEEEEEEHDHNVNNKEAHNQNGEEHHLVDPSSSPPSPGRGVKEDLSELTKTLTSQFWGVASFLAPPPPSEHSQISSSNPNEPSYPVVTTSDQASTEPEGISGIRNDFAEIGGKFRSGISRLSSNIAVSEITKMASNILQLGSEEDNYDPVIIGGVGVTDEVVTFVRDIAMHPKTWLDFPLPKDEDDEDFDMSDAQQEHALAIERLAPRLAALRIELCPGYMSEGCFWKIYFVLLHPRLDIHDAELLSTPQIVKARALLTQELQNHMKATPEEDLSKRNISYSKGISNSPHEECPDESLPLETSAPESVNSRVAADSETEKHPILSTEFQIIDKSVIEEGPVNKNEDQNLLSHSPSNAVKTKDEDDRDDWLQEENLEIVGASGPTISIENEQDVSFSDLEEDDEIEDAPTSYKKVISSTKDS